MGCCSLKKKVSQSLFMWDLFLPLARGPASCLLGCRLFGSLDHWENSLYSPLLFSLSAVSPLPFLQNGEEGAVWCFLDSCSCNCRMLWTTEASFCFHSLFFFSFFISFKAKRIGNCLLGPSCITGSKTLCVRERGGRERENECLSQVPQGTLWLCVCVCSFLCFEPAVHYVFVLR